MNLYEYDIKVLLIKDIKLVEIGYELGSFINRLLCTDDGWKEIHYNKSFKGYSFNYLFPLAMEGIYKRGGVYNFQLRVVSDDVERILDQYLRNYYNDSIKTLTYSKRSIEDSRRIERIFTTTPLIIKREGAGYWRPDENIEFFEDRIKSNMIKKYNYHTGEDVKSADIYTGLTIDNKKPIAVNYKEIRLLGDKVTLYLSNDELSQRIAFVSLGMGLGENNVSLGAGFVNFKY